MRTTLIPALISLLALGACAGSESERVAPPSLDPKLQTELAAWLEVNGKPPADYVVGLFADHDVVFLGEQHRVKHDVLFVQSLMEPLYQAGVRTVALEFGRREDQPLVDSLLGAAAWDENLAREIMLRQFVFWGYREYVDLYKAVWQLNRSLPEGAPPCRVLALGDSPDWSHIKTEADRDNPEVMRAVWQGGGEDHWAKVILDAVDAGEKVLVYCGIHHAFSEYRQPIVSGGVFLRFDGSLRCGNHVYAALGKRAVTVFLHAPWNGQAGYASDMVHPADGVIDALMLAVGPHPVGFDATGGPFGELRIKDAVYRHGYEDFKLADFCDGWIYTGPISEYGGVTPIPGWINADNLEYAQAQSPNPRFRQATPERFNTGIASDAEIHRRWGYLR